MMKMLIHRNPWSDAIDFLIVEDRFNKRSVGIHVTLKDLPDPPNGDILEPTFRLKPEACQDLMDQLWQVGFRPSEGTGSAGALAATQKHLDDMRRLVFDKPATVQPPTL